MRALSIATLAFTLLNLPSMAQTAPSPGWADPASWAAVKPVATRNIVYANVPAPGNPTANPDPGLASGGMPRLPNSAEAAAGTLDLHLDVLQVASAKPTPVVLQLHGGGWIRGDRPASYKTFSALLAAGMSVVTVDYRVGKEAPAPAAIEDTRCAMAWVKANAAKYNFDADRVILYGGSAGGHLALMGAYAPASFTPAKCADQPKVVAVLDFYGPTNLAEGLSQRGSSDFTHQWLATDMHTGSYGSAGGGKASAPNWPTPDAKTLARAREMSPLTYVHPGLPPTFIVNGDSDHTVDPSQSAELKKALDGAHIPNGQDTVPGGGHGNFSPAESDKAMLLCLQFLKANGVIE